ncbi:MAG: nuclear transport factor 2 family protein [Thermodesulfobacteriota bacterium]
MRAVRWLVVFGILLCAAGQACADAADPQTEKEIKEIGESFVKAYEKKDLAQLMSLFAQDKDVVVLDNSPNGRHVGTTEIKAAFEKEFADTPKVTIKTEWMSVGGKGDVAWFAGELTAKMESPEEKLTIPVRWSGQLTKRQGKWLFLLAHFSFSGPEPEVPKTK